MFRLTGVFRALLRTVCRGADDMPKGKFYFSVRKGFKPGVYKTWDECKGQVDKFPGACFKKFASEKDAWAFFRGVVPSPVPQVKKVCVCVCDVWCVFCAGVTSWVKTWRLNGWRLKSGGPITNKDEFMKLDRLNAEADVVWLHVPGHSGIRGNEEADRLSREGALKPLPKKQQ
ncbi:ribonuclease H1 [Pseudochaenichthys georgianus]|uniref:ribonuclease H1 n=1 Tax=Pseudochaenichthys georgianus TaxID=52239 RepID=UPI00146B3141|nr:ribonuclease H1 [Pseudochaenichthys georgianus]